MMERTLLEGKMLKNILDHFFDLRQTIRKGILLFKVCLSTQLKYKNYLLLLQIKFLIEYWNRSIHSKSFWNGSHAIPLQRGLVFTKITYHRILS